MKRFVFSLLSVLLTIFPVYAQLAPAMEWSECFGGLGGHTFADIKQTGDGGYVACGTEDPDFIDSLVPHAANFWVVKFTSDGLVEWDVVYGGSNIEGAASITETGDGDFIVVGLTVSDDGDIVGNHGGNDIWVLRLNSSGELVWQKCFGGSGGEYATSIIKTSDGNYLISGITDSNDGDVTGFHVPYYYGDDYWIIKMNGDGDIIWAKCYGGYNYDIAGSVIETYDGNYVIAGWSLSNDGDVSGNHGAEDAWVLKIDPSGDILWQRSYGMGEPDLAFDIAEDANHNLVVAGRSKSNIAGAHGGFDYWMFKINENGKVYWTRLFGGSKQDRGSDVIVLEDGNYVIGGWSASIDGDVSDSHKQVDYFISGTDPEGNLLWTNALGGKSSDFMYCIEPTTNNGFIISGNSSSSNGDVYMNHTGSSEAWTIKFGGYPGGKFDDNATTAELPLISPNPFNSSLQINGNPSGAQLSDIRIINAAGQIVMELSYGDNISYPVVVNTGEFLPGIYFIEIIYDEYTTIDRVVKMK